jgi:hypothetical protein
MQSLRAARSLSMQEEVRPPFHTRFRSFLRLSSFAGQGLPERMRSTAFAFLGLTAAAGLALVAFFAQLGFPLLSPAPMPSDPSRANAVAEAKVVTTNPGLSASVPARTQRGTAPQEIPNRGGSRQPAQADPRTDDAAPVASPEPVSSGVGRGGATTEPVETTAPTPAPAPVESPPPASSPPPAAAPVAEPAPAEPPKPEVRPANSKPSKPEPKPVKSKPPKPEAKPAKVKPESKPAKPAPAPSYEPAPVPPPAPVDKGKDKEKGKPEK